jgi:hypothetical protein
VTPSEKICKKCGVSNRASRAKYCGDGSDKDNEHNWIPVPFLQAYPPTPSPFSVKHHRRGECDCELCEPPRRDV